MTLQEVEVSRAWAAYVPLGGVQSGCQCSALPQFTRACTASWARPSSVFVIMSREGCNEGGVNASEARLIFNDWFSELPPCLDIRRPCSLSERNLPASCSFHHHSLQHSSEPFAPAAASPSSRPRTTRHTVRRTRTSIKHQHTPSPMSPSCPAPSVELLS